MLLSMRILSANCFLSQVELKKLVILLKIHWFNCQPVSKSIVTQETLYLALFFQFNYLINRDVRGQQKHKSSQLGALKVCFKLDLMMICLFIQGWVMISRLDSSSINLSPLLNNKS